MRKSTALVLASLPLLLLLQCSASPIRYDQRQDGDQNVDARLQNFFVVVSPTAQLGSGINLLDLASKAVPLRLRPQGVVSAADGLKQREEAEGQQDQEVKEAKSGRSVQSPLNAVVIPAAILQSPLAKLHPEVQALSVEEVLIARSPVVELRSPPGPAPAPGAGAVPMLVAVPVPEVAPERPAAPPALLPMHPAAPGALGDKQAPAAAPAADSAAAPAIAPAAEAAAPETIAIPEAIAAPETIAVRGDIAAPEAIIAVPEAIIAVPEANIAIPEAIAAPDAIASDLAAAPIVAPVEVAAPAVETNQIEQETGKEEFEAAEVSKVHLIGTAIEECGPERIRDNEGVCVDAVQRN